MAVFDLYSKRKADREKKTTDVFIYDAIPEQIRVQIVQMLQESFGKPDKQYSSYYE